MRINHANKATAWPTSTRAWRIGLCLILLAGLAGCGQPTPLPAASTRASATAAATLSPTPMVITAAPPQPTAQSTAALYPPPARTASATADSYPQPLASPQAVATSQAEPTQTGGVTLSIAFTNDVGGQTDPCG